MEWIRNSELTQDIAPCVLHNSANCQGMDVSPISNRVTGEVLNEKYSILVGRSCAQSRCGTSVGRRWPVRLFQDKNVVLRAVLPAARTMLCSRTNVLRSSTNLLCASTNVLHSNILRASDVL